MARNPKDPMVFDLPDNDSVSLITWDFVVDKFESILAPICQNIAVINTDLQRINDRVDEWLEEQNGG